MEPKYKKVNFCRVCNSKRIIDLEVNKKFYLANLDKIIGINYSLCSDCNFVFQSEYVGDDFLNFYYERSPMLRRENPTPFEIDQNFRQSGFVSRNLDIESKSVLEIGAHAGSFLSHLFEEFNCDCYFEELSEEARKLLSSKKGLKDYRKNSSKKIDLIILRHVLEHIFDLEAFFNYLKTITNYNSYLFIEVPDWTSPGKNTDPLMFEHLSQFNSYNLNYLLNLHGFSIEALEKSVNPNDPATPNKVLRVIAKLNLKDKRESIKNQFNDYAEKQLFGWIKELNEVLRENKNKSIALYPASHLSFDAILNSNLKKYNLLGLYDLDKKKHNKKYLDLKVFPTNQLITDNPDIVLLFTLAFEPEIRKSFCDLGLTSKVISLNELIKMCN